ncbi:ABC transporter substrate-binding protein [Ancylobacter sp. A5.8]|uniref:ABC transporter substrate-binding protein n=1 Tax=Ancylobacter gelatini TaxID=2919920 RepID=UPI001F4EF86A|nr:ABC transporter substrate-binding protein [Ancylobacter gelatini]MCJ8143294.1 ABC transporter substrate-binding protein [Ancylobacter gelatini]
MMIFKKIVATLLLLGAVSAPSAHAETNKMTIGTGVDPAFSAFYVADKMGIFKKNDLDVDLKTGPSGSAMVGLLIQNQMQGAFGAEQAGILNSTLDPNVSVIAEGAALQRWFAIVGRNLESLDSLKGKRIGVARGTGSEIFWLALVDKLGLNVKDYDVIQVDAPEMIAALERGDIDAYSAWEPWVSKGLAAIPDTKILRDNEGVIEGRVYFYVNDGWVKANPEAAKRFTKSLVEATAAINDKPEEATRIIASFLKLDEEMLSGMMKKIRFDVRLDQQSIDNLVIGAKQLEAAKKLRKPVDWQQFVKPELLRSVAPDKVNFTAPQ